MPFDGKPDDFGNGGGGGGSPYPNPLCVKLAFSMMVSSLFAAQGYAFGDTWGLNPATASLQVAEGEHDGLAIPEDVIESAIGAAKALMEGITGRVCDVSLHSIDPPPIN